MLPGRIPVSRFASILSPHATVFMGLLYVCFNQRWGTPDKLFVCARPFKWAEEELPANLAHCYGLTSNSRHLCLYFRAKNGNIYLASRSGTEMSWTLSSALPSKTRHWAGMTILDDNVHLLGGQVHFKRPPCIPSNACYNLIYQTWSLFPGPGGALPALPTPRTGFHALEIGEVQYVLGGHEKGEDATTSYELFSSLEEKKWLPTSLPKIRQACGATSHGGLAWIAGGGVYPSAHSDVYCMDFTTGDTVALPQLLSPRRYGSLVVFHDQLLLIGGSDGRTYHSTVQTLDMST